MTRSGPSVIALCAVVLMGLTGCGDEFGLGGRSAANNAAPTVVGGTTPTATTPGSAGGGSNTAPPASSGGNRAPTIAGSPAGSVAPGVTYIFQPLATDVENDFLTFAATNLPAWARFDTASGQISGTPGAGDVGSYGPVTVSVSDGRSTVALAPFVITVGQGGGIVGSGSRSVTLAWQAPTLYTDGTPLRSLASYKIHYGASPRSYSNVVAVSNPSLTRYVIENLAPGTYYVAMTSVSAEGLESGYSDETVARLN